MPSFLIETKKNCLPKNGKQALKNLLYFRVHLTGSPSKGPRGFYIPTPVREYSPDWAISFKKDSVKHIFFIAETKGTMNSLQLRPIEQAKITCAKKLFNKLSTNEV